jgi:hypothetical protein
MADYQFNTNLTPAAQGTNLGDMVNMARGVQSYQQAAQLNPLQLQKAQMEIEQLQKLNPLAVQKATADTGTSELNLSKDQNKISLEMFGGLRNDPDIVNASKNPQAALQKIKKFEALIENAGVPKQKIAPVASFLMNETIKNPSGLTNHLDALIQAGIGATGQQSLQTPEVLTVNGAPATFQRGPAIAKEITIGGQPAGGNAGGAVGGGAPTGVTQTQMGLSYQVRKPGDIRPLAPNEAADAERGAKYRNDLITRQTDLSKSRRNLDEVIEAAGKIEKEDFFSTGVLGAATRNIKGALGDEKYKQLSKDLANVQISNMQAMGGSMETDAGKQLVRMANGDETYPPEVLKKIARRTYSDLTNLDMQATGAAKFAKKYGDSNLSTFKQQWSSNADSKVFEAMALFENIKDPAKRKAEIDKLMGNNPEQRQEFFQKYNNIKKLTATGEL